MKSLFEQMGEREVAQKNRDAYGTEYAPIIMFDSEQRVSRLLNEDAEERAALKELRQRQRPQNKSRNRDYER